MYIYKNAFNLVEVFGEFSYRKLLNRHVSYIRRKIKIRMLVFKSGLYGIIERWKLGCGKNRTWGKFWQYYNFYKELTVYAQSSPNY